MAARRLARPACREGRADIATRFKPGQSGNPTGKSKEVAKAEVALRELASAFGAAPDPGDPGGRPRGVVALAKLFSLGVDDGNVPALTAFCDRVGLKPVDRAEVTGDGFVFTIRKRIVGDDGTDSTSG